LFGSRVRVAVGALGLGLVLAAPETALAAQVEEGRYPHLIEQRHIGRRCTHEDIVVAGGTVVGAGGQVVAGGGGTGVGCDTFYAYELRAGEPSSRQPFVEPGYTLRPRPDLAAIIP
jgi:hypothetical protein